MLRAAWPIATTFASEFWPASSTNRTSTLSTIRSVAHTHDVPVTRLAEPAGINWP